WDRVHEEAERLEHAASDELIDRMAAAIGEPATDPHGAPIPTREGTLDIRPLLALSDVEVGGVVRVRQVGDRDPERLRYLAELGGTRGAEVRVIGREPFGGPLTLRIEREGSEGKRSVRRGARLVRERAIGPELAAEVYVAPLESGSRRSSGRGGGAPGKRHA